MVFRSIVVTVLWVGVRHRDFSLTRHGTNSLWLSQHSQTTLSLRTRTSECLDDFDVGCICRYAGIRFRNTAVFWLVEPPDTGNLISWYQTWKSTLCLQEGNPWTGSTVGIITKEKSNFLSFHLVPWLRNHKSVPAPKAKHNNILISSNIKSDWTSIITRTDPWNPSISGAFGHWPAFHTFVDQQHHVQGYLG